METSEPPPLDETVYRSPEAVEWYGGINANNIHLYFLGSPFCAPESNNKVLELQSQFDEQSRRIIADRHAFEDRLRSMTGIEYMIIDGPDPLKPETHGNPVWVIRKHRREKEQGQPDRVTILGTYYAVGDVPICNIYQAPSLYDILKNGLDYVSLQLKEFFDTAYKMQHFTPAEGYSYLKSDPKKAAAVDVSAQTSRAATPEHDVSTQSLGPGEKTEANKQATSSDDALLWESLQQTLMYMDEFMDENPLQGEPGSFFFTSTQDHVRTQKRVEETAAAEASKQNSQGASRTSSTGTTPQPPPIKTEGLPRKGSKATSPLSATAKAKRRKSKAPASPTAPKSP